MFEKQNISSQIPNLELVGTGLNLGKNLSLTFSLVFVYFGCAGSSLLCGLFSGCGTRGYPLVAVPGLLIVVTSLVMELGL